MFPAGFCRSGKMPHINHLVQWIFNNLVLFKQVLSDYVISEKVALTAPLNVRTSSTTLSTPLFLSLCTVSLCHCLKYWAHQSKLFFSKQSVVLEWKLPGHHGLCQYHPAPGFNETAWWVELTQLDCFVESMTSTATGVDMNEAYHLCIRLWFSSFLHIYLRLSVWKDRKNYSGHQRYMRTCIMGSVWPQEKKTLKQKDLISKLASSPSEHQGGTHNCSAFILYIYSFIYLFCLL